MKRTIFSLSSLFALLICSEIVLAQPSADFSRTFDSGFSVQKRRYWNERSELANSQWRLGFTSNSAATTTQVDNVISKIKTINVKATISKNIPPASDSDPVLFQKEFTMADILASGQSLVNYEKIYSPSYNVNEGHWSYPILASNYSLMHELFINLPGDTFIVWTNQNPPPWIFWDITLTFDDGSQSHFWDRWVGFSPSGAALEYSPMYWVDDDIPEGNSTYSYVNLKSLKIFQINELDAPGKKNLLFVWDPINPLYDINKFPNEGDGFIQTTSGSAAHPGWELKFYCSWRDEKNGVLPQSGLNLRTSEFVFVGMPAHMNHFVLPWSYLEYAISNSTQDGFQVSFHSRCRNNRLREISSFSKTKIFEFDHDYPEWSIAPHKKNNQHNNNTLHK